MNVCLCIMSIYIQNIYNEYIYVYNENMREIEI